MEDQKPNIHDEFIRSLVPQRLTANLWSTGKVLFGHKIAQYPVDLVLWDVFLHRRVAIKSIVELGSAAFGLSLFLALQAKQRGMEFRTFDIRAHDNLDSPLSKLVGLRDNFVCGDIFGNVKYRLISLLVHELPHPVLLYCDDGDKPREFREFVPYLRVGDYVGVHDWGREIQLKDVSIFDDAVVSLYWEEWHEMGSITRFMKVVR
ncbi:hypothetical protein KKH23_05175, partial [Patescibacteria group bacterium]|nr:hypothetical protein [Patescibacteria group bacterium]